MLEAKAKLRQRHTRAIILFHGWCAQHPGAKLARRIEVFDALVDGKSIKVKKRGKSTLIR